MDCGKVTDELMIFSEKWYRYCAPDISIILLIDYRTTLPVFIASYDIPFFTFIEL
jgi:hypothetical protein